MEKEIYIIRHGRTEYNKLGIWQGSSVDMPLDEVGRKEALAFYKAYNHVEFDLIIHSTLKRSKETVALFNASGAKYVEAPDINEISWGIYEGKPHNKKSLAEYKSVIAAWAEENYEVAFKGGESAKDLGDRISRFIGWLKSVEHKKILICSHGRAIRGLICLMNNEALKEMEKYDHANTGLFKAILKDDEFKFSIYNNVDHLNGGV